jgi:hypothetical protein
MSEREVDDEELLVILAVAEPAAQLTRFDHAAHRLAAGHVAALVAAESDYADQSPRHRDVMAFAAVTPTAVAFTPWLAVDDVAWAAPELVSKT